MPLVNRSNSPDVQWPNWEPTTAPTTPPPPAPNQVEALPPQVEADAVWSKSKLTETFSGLHDGDAYVLNGKVSAKAEEGAAIGAKLRAVREDDGSLKVSVSGEGAFLYGEEAEGNVKIGAGTTYRFPAGHDADAAELVDSLLKGAVVVAAPPGTQTGVSLVVSGELPGSLAERIAKHSSNLTAVKVEAGIGMHVGDDYKLKSGFAAWNFAKAKGELEASQSFTVNLQKGTFVVDRTVELQGDAAVNVPFLLKAGVNGGASATLSAEYAMSPEMKRRIADGSLSPAEAWGQLINRGVPDKMSAKLEVGATEKTIGTIASASTKTTAEVEVELDVAAFLEDPNPKKVLEEMSHAKWTVETESGVGAGLAAGGEIGTNKLKLSAELTAQRTHTWKMEGLTFSEAAERLEHPDTDQQLLDAQRALAAR